VGENGNSPEEGKEERGGLKEYHGHVRCITQRGRKTTSGEVSFVVAHGKRGPEGAALTKKTWRGARRITKHIQGTWQKLHVNLGWNRFSPAMTPWKLLKEVPQQRVTQKKKNQDCRITGRPWFFQRSGGQQRWMHPDVCWGRKLGRRGGTPNK